MMFTIDGLECLIDLRTYIERHGEPQRDTVKERAISKRDH